MLWQRSPWGRRSLTLTLAVVLALIWMRVAGVLVALLTLPLLVRLLFALQKLLLEQLLRVHLLLNPCTAAHASINAARFRHETMD